MGSYFQSLAQMENLLSNGLFTKRIAHGRVSASWSYEATAPASEFTDKYCARARHGV